MSITIDFFGILKFSVQKHRIFVLRWRRWGIYLGFQLSLTSKQNYLTRVFRKQASSVAEFLEVCFQMLWKIGLIVNIFPSSGWLWCHLGARLWSWELWPRPESSRTRRAHLEQLQGIKCLTAFFKRKSSKRHQTWICRWHTRSKESAR